MHGGESSPRWLASWLRLPDCHIPAEGANGEYTSHTASSLENKQLIENDCSKCHDSGEEGQGHPGQREEAA